MAIPQAVESILADKLKDVLTRWCITDVADDDESRVDFVIIGKPTKELRKKNVVSVHTDHPLGPSRDTDFQAMGTPRSSQERPYKWPTETTGGMRTKQITGAVQINIRQDTNYETAKAINSAVSTRVEMGINRDAALRSFYDDFGQFVSIIDTYEGLGYQAGGGNTSINIRWIDWRAIVHSENCRGCPE